ncbi:MAG: V-type ATP synthase subunit A [Candidatus Omnitrophota bacterium]|jgi:V/A-type H+-transporting ATPase subunit A
MSKNIGLITGINGNMISVSFTGSVQQNEVGFVVLGQERLMSEVIRIRGNTAYLQVFESTKGIKVGDRLEFSGQMLAVQLGPGLLGQIYDGLQNPLVELAEEFGFFLKRGVFRDALDFEKEWEFSALAKKGDKVSAGAFLGFVPEGIFKHYIMVPFDFAGEYTVEKIVAQGKYKTRDIIATLKDEQGNSQELDMVFTWPVKTPIKAYKEKLPAREPLVTRVRITDTLFPIVKGGTYCIPGPFGSGKTVLQQIISRYAEIDIVVIAACGERAGEVVETLREFPNLIDPRSGKSLIERTIIICNTSSMPVAAREASVYTAATLAEYYRQMGLDVLLLADSTSRWAQAMREVSGRLEEIPGEEAYPAYLESHIASFYERAGKVKLINEKEASLTIGGTVSPAGGNFEEPVTQATLKVVGAFHGLSRDRANARKFPSIDPLDSWSKYSSFVPQDLVDLARDIMFKGNEINQMMKVVGEEGTSIEDFIIYLKSEFLDSIYLQQNAFDKVDAQTPAQRQEYVFAKVIGVLKANLPFPDKDKARQFFYSLRQLFIDWNYKPWDSSDFHNQEKDIDKFIAQDSSHEKGIQ